MRAVSDEARRQRICISVGIGSRSRAKEAIGAVSREELDRIGRFCHRCRSFVLYHRASLHIGPPPNGIRNDQAMAIGAVVPWTRRDGRHPRLVNGRDYGLCLGFGERPDCEPTLWVRLLRRVTSPGY